MKHSNPAVAPRNSRRSVTALFPLVLPRGTGAARIYPTVAQHITHILGSVHGLT